MGRLLRYLDPRTFGWRDASLVFFVGLLAYGTQIILPAFNADDVIQMQSVAGDGGTYVASGRWGYYLVASLILEANPAGILPGAVAVLLVTLAAWISAITIGLRSYIATFVFCLVATVSLFYGLLFSFDSARLAEALGTLCATGGLYLATRGRYALAVMLLLSAPAFYTASIELAACVALATAIVVLLREGARAAVRDLCALVVVLAVAVILYYLSTYVASWLSGIPLSGRSTIQLAEAWQSLGGIGHYFLTYSLPIFSPKSQYWTVLMRLCVAAIVFLFVVSLLASKLPSSTGRGLMAEVAVLCGLALALVIAPFGLAVATPIDQLGERSLYSFATVSAAMLGIAIDASIASERKFRKLLVSVAAAVGFAFSAENALAVSKMGYDEYLTSESDLAMVNRIISRIDTVLSVQSVADPRHIPLAVKIDTWFLAGPRGALATAMWYPWSREWIFRLVDNRFVPADTEHRDAAVRVAESHGIWPAANSVFVDDGVVVVRLD